MQIGMNKFFNAVCFSGFEHQITKVKWQFKCDPTHFHPTMHCFKHPLILKSFDVDIKGKLDHLGL